MKDKLTIFVDRLRRIGIEISLTGNYPWVYLDKINGRRVTETFRANHGFCIAYLPIRKDQSVAFTDMVETFNLIRKYVGKPIKK